MDLGLVLPRGILEVKEGPVIQPLPNNTVLQVLSKTGTRQGDPLAGALFALGHLRILKKTHRDNPQCYLPSIADDTYLVGPAAAVKKAYQGFITEAATVGLSVKTSKCFQYFPLGATDEQARHLIDGVQVLEGGLTILGSPLGNEEFMIETLDKSLLHKGRGLGSLPLLHDSQAAFNLLLKCFSPRIHYMLRCTPLSPAGMTRVMAFHKELVHTMELLTGFTPGTMPRLARKQAELPIAQGGMGLIPPIQVAPAAILGAWALSSSRLPTLFPANLQMGAFVADADTGDHPLQRHLQQARSIFLHVLPTLPTLADIAAEPVTQIQAQCSAKLGENLSTIHLATLQDPDNKARFRSVSCRHAGAWIEAGGTYKDTRMTSDEFATGTRLRLGLPHPEMAGLIKCLCKSESDALGHHHLHCPNGQSLVLAHNSVRDCLASIFRRAGYNVLLEKQGQLLMHGEGAKEKQRTDIVLTKAGLKILVDVTIRDPTAPFVVRTAATTAHAAARKGEKDKERAYRNTPPGVRFLPAAFEPYGAWGEQIAGFLQAAMAAVGAQDRDHPNLPYLRGRLYQQLSAAITRGVAQGLLAKFQSLSSPAAKQRKTPPREEESNGAFLSEIRKI